MKRNFVIMMVVAMATMVMVGCKPLTGCTHIYDDGVVTEPTCAANGVKTYTCTLCGDKQYEPIPATGNHTWVDTDDTKVKSVTCGEKGLKPVYVSPKCKCSVCGKEENKTVVFFYSPTTIGVASGTSLYNEMDEEYSLPIDEELIKFFNSYYENRDNYSNNCNCGGECVNKCGGNCLDKDCYCGELTCIRRVGNKLYFGDYYIEY